VFHSIPDLPINIRPSSKKDIFDATKAMNFGKAAPSNNITAKVLKADPYATADIILPLIHDMRQEENIPKNGEKEF
jgi:hypothetical protein